MVSLDPHPTDILRLGLALGVLEGGMDSLSKDTKALYSKFINQMIDFVAAGDTEIQLQQSGGQMDKYPLKELLVSAQEIGKFISMSPLDSLGGKPICVIETWADKDEALVQQITNQLLDSKDISTLLGFAVEHLIAAASLAVLMKPALYDEITTKVNSQLDHFAVTLNGIMKKIKPRLFYVKSCLPVWYDLQTNENVII